MPDSGIGIRCIGHRTGYVPSLARNRPCLGLQSNARMDAVGNVGGGGRTPRTRVVAGATGLLGYYFLRLFDRKFFRSLSSQIASLQPMYLGPNLDHRSVWTGNPWAQST